MKHTLSINIDEIGTCVSDVLPFLKRNNIDKVELRTINGKNFANFTSVEVINLKQELGAHGIFVEAIASPLFKWYKTTPVKIQVYDDYNFPCILTISEKFSSIERVMSNATQIGANKVRVFSGLNSGNSNINETISDPLFAKMLQIGAQYNIMILLENEPVCHAYELSSIKIMLDYYPQLGFWLDVANFYQIGELITIDQIRELLPRVHHIHLKDLTFENENICYVPFGTGVIPWKEILYVVYSEALHPISLSIETHASNNKKEATEFSISNFRNILSTINPRENED